MKPFCIDAAKRGEPVLMDALHTSWNYLGPVFFVGLGENGIPIVEMRGNPTRVSVEYLRMAPRHTVLMIEIWRDKSGVYTSRVVYPNGYASNFFDYGEKVETVSCVVVE